MGNFSKLRNDARSFIGRNWGKAKQFLGNARGAIDAGVGAYEKLKPIIQEGVEAYGNTRVRAFNQKIQQGVEAGARIGQQYAREAVAHVDKIDDLANRAFTTFA